MMELKDKIKEANKKAANRMTSAEPVLIDLKPAIEVVPGMKDNSILHAGPPIEWERMCSTVKEFAIKTIMNEKLAKTREEAIKMAKRDEIEFSPAHDHNAVVGGYGVISASQYVFILQNKSPPKNVAFGYFPAGYVATRSKTTRTREPKEVSVERSTVQVDPIKAALQECGGLNLKTIIARGLNMGCDFHGGGEPATALMVMKLAPYLAGADLDKNVITQTFESLDDFGAFSISVAMPACKVITDAAHGIEYSTVVTVMSRNGVEFGIKISGLDDQWFTAPAPMVEGIYMPGVTEKDVVPDLGDSSVTETAGLGGLAVAASPGFMLSIGKTSADAFRQTKDMGEITITKNSNFAIQWLDYEGVPTGIDCRKVLETGILPRITTGISRKKPSLGKGGFGISKAPMECFKKALIAFNQKYG